MITKDELLKRIDDSSGDWQEDGVTFKADKDGTVHADDEETGMGGFIMKHVGDDMGKFYVSSSFNLEDLSKAIKFSKKIAKILGVGLIIEGAETIEKVVEVKNEKEEARLGGMVEAYEKILTGREFSAKA